MSAWILPIVCAVSLWSAIAVGVIAYQQDRRLDAMRDALAESAQRERAIQSRLIYALAQRGVGADMAREWDARWAGKIAGDIARLREASESGDESAYAALAHLLPLLADYIHEEIGRSLDGARWHLEPGSILRLERGP